MRVSLVNNFDGLLNVTPDSGIMPTVIDPDARNMSAPDVIKDPGVRPGRRLAPPSDATTDRETRLFLDASGHGRRERGRHTMQVRMPDARTARVGTRQPLIESGPVWVS